MAKDKSDLISRTPTEILSRLDDVGADLTLENIKEEIDYYLEVINEEGIIDPSHPEFSEYDHRQAKECIAWLRAYGE